MILSKIMTQEEFCNLIVTKERGNIQPYIQFMLARIVLSGDLENQVRKTPVVVKIKYKNIEYITYGNPTLTEQGKFQHPDYYNYYWYVYKEKKYPQRGAK